MFKGREVEGQKLASGEEFVVGIRLRLADMPGDSEMSPMLADVPWQLARGFSFEMIAEAGAIEEDELYS